MTSTATFPPQASRTPRGTKRSAEGSLANDERLAKRFDLLHLENGSRIYIPVTTATSTLSAPPSSSLPIPTATLLPSTPRQQTRRRSNATSSPSPSRIPRPVKLPSQSSTPASAQQALAVDDSMTIDDTPHRIYISNLDDELSDDSTESEQFPIFLPDIEAQLNRIPDAVLRASTQVPRSIDLKDGGADDEKKGRELVLFRDVPASVSNGGGEGVRKAMMEARRRAREADGINSINGGINGNVDEDADMDVEVGSMGDDEAMDMD